MARTKKFEEKYIRLKKSSSSGKEVSFQVYIRDKRIDGGYYSATYPFDQYGGKELAFETAKKDRDRVLSIISQLGQVSHKTTTYNDIFEEYMKSTNFTQSTLRKKRLYHTNYIQNVVGNIPINKITPQMLRTLLKNCADQATDEALHRVINNLNITFSYALYNDYLDINPMVKVDTKNFKGQKRKRKSCEKELRMEDYLGVRNYLISPSKYAGNKKHYYDTIAIGLDIMYYTGIRPGECFGLKKSNIDFKTNTITIEESISSGKDRMNEAILSPTKTKTSVRKIPIPNQLIDELKEKISADNSKFLLSNENGELYSIEKISQTISMICKEHNWTFNMYQLRHNFATSLITENVDYRTVQELMGHSSFNMSVYYAQSNDKLKQNALSKIANLPS